MSVSCLHTHQTPIYKTENVPELVYFYCDGGMKFVYEVNVHLYYVKLSTFIRSDTILQWFSYHQPHNNQLFEPETFRCLHIFVYVNLAAS